MEFVVKSARRQARRLFLLPSDGERVASRKETAGEANSGDFDPELRKVIDAWPTLPQAVRQEIAATIQAHSTKGAE